MAAQIVRPGPYVDNDQPVAFHAAYSGPFRVNEKAGIVIHYAQVSAIPSWTNTTQERHVRFIVDDELELSVLARNLDGVVVTHALTWSRETPRS